MLWVCLPVLATDLAWESPAQPVPAHLEVPVFTGPLVDTGWWPSANDPLAVRFYITPFGDAIADVDADSQLAWPAPLWQRTVPVPETGRLEVDAGVDMAAQVQIDIGIYSGVIDVWSQAASLRGSSDFDGMLLAGHPTQEVSVAVNDPGLVPPVEYGISIITGIELVFELQTYPSLETVLSAGEVRGTFPQGDTLQLDEGAWSDLEVDGSPELAGDLVWSADLDGSLDVVFEPALVLDTWIGDFSLLSIPLPVTIVDLTDRYDADPIAVVHPLPVLAALPDRHDFGDVDVGGLATFLLDLPNEGRLWVEGTARIEGDPAFTVFPEVIAAQVGSTDGLVVSFDPARAATFTGELVITSNDPAQPEVRLQLVGTGVEEPEPPGTDPTDPIPDPSDGASGGDGERVEARGCGCQASAGPAGAGAGLLLLLALAARRRR